MVSKSVPKNDKFDLLNLDNEMNTQAPPSPKQAITANFSVFLICSCHTDRIGSITMARSVTRLVIIKHFKSSI